MCSRTITSLPARCVSLSAHVHTGCPHPVIYKASQTLALGITLSPPLLLRTLSEHSTYPLTLCGTRIIFLVLKQSWLNLRQTPRSFSHCSSNSLAARRSCWVPAMLDESVRSGDHAGDAFFFINDRIASRVHDMRSGLCRNADLMRSI